MSGADTSVGQGQSQFPPTAWSLVERVRDPRDPRVREYVDRMVHLYWRPVYKFVRLSWKRSNEDAKDLTQAFFVHLLEGNLFAQADPDRGNFRRLLLASLRNFLANEHRAVETVKRGGGRTVVSLDAADGERWAGDDADPADAFEGQWARELLGRAIARLAETCRPEAVAAFRAFHLDARPVKEIAAGAKVAETQVAHWLYDARGALRRIVVELVREYVQDDAEVGRELDLLFRAWR